MSYEEEDTCQCKLYRLKDIVFKIAKKLEITGPLNMQVLHTPAGELKVIETNVLLMRC